MGEMSISTTLICSIIVPLVGLSWGAIPILAGCFLISTRMVIPMKWMMRWRPEFLDMIRTHDWIEVRMFRFGQRYRLSRMERIGDRYIMKYPFRLFRFYPDVPVTVTRVEDLGPVE